MEKERQRASGDRNFPLFLGIDSAPSRFLPKSQIKKKREKGEGTRNKGKLKRAREKQGRRCHQNLNYSRISKLFVKGSKILERERERERKKERKKEKKRKLERCDLHHCKVGETDSSQSGKCFKISN